MTVEQQFPIAVFLGPSLPLDVATGLLNAHYLPPAKFGDVYRLIGSGVHTIVLIDGVFHGHAPVWQRELLYAIQNGIRIFGASSMGALRAAELHVHGMAGIGTIFQWYVTGEIDGDDEVALLHAGPELQYRPMTQPLVNIRFKLREAVACNILEAGQAAALVSALKAMPFFERTADALWDVPAFRALDASGQEQLRTFFKYCTVDLKRRDAVQVLAEVALRQDRPAVDPSAANHRHESASHYDRFRLLKRSFPCGSGHTLEGQALVERVLEDPARRKLLQWWQGAQFFVREWALNNGVSVPPDELSTMTTAFREQMVAPPLVGWLRANGLTAAEYGELLPRHLQWTWLLEQAPEQFGLSSNLQDEALLPTFPDMSLLQPVSSRATLARALPYVAAWCRSVGAAPEPKTTAVLTDRWCDALGCLAERHGQSSCESFLHAVWALERGPVYFGYATWSLAAELLCSLQFTGVAAKLASQRDTAGSRH